MVEIQQRRASFNICFENRPNYLLIDELEKSSPKHQTFLLNLLETGIISETKFGKTREMTMNTSVFGDKQ